MTQEELDELMAGDTDEEVAILEKEIEEKNDSKNEELEFDDENVDIDSYRVEADTLWPPPPPTNDHKVVNQLDDVTKDSEEKASEIFDKLEKINNNTMDIEGNAISLIELVEKNIEIFSKLSIKYPDIKTFEESLSQNQEILKNIKLIITDAQQGTDEIMMIMDIMQYQDIHRQKIERVINVMRALSKYMNSLFYSDIDDKSRVSSATYIAGDENTNVLNEEDIEALIAGFEK